MGCDHAAIDCRQMMGEPKKAILFSPFWGQPGHVGNNRVDRFVRWLAEDGYTVVIVRAGASDGQRNETWGHEITVHDRMGLHNDHRPGEMASIRPRKPNRWRRELAYWLFRPDPVVVWANHASRHPAVLRAMEGASFILSSSPPESAHVGAWNLSKSTGVPHIVDLRDGWLDEPLKPLLRRSALRRWSEGRMEARILRDAKTIQVTSDVWQELLCARVPDVRAKVRVLTNGYPMRHADGPQHRSGDTPDELVLIHSGRFTGSRLTQLPRLLLEPLLSTLTRQPAAGVIKLLGALTIEELELIEPYKPRFETIGWRIDCPGSMPRAELLKLLPQADGLLLLCASQAAIPSKLFEYIPTGKPIFAVTEKDSATWRVCCRLKKTTLIPINSNSIGSGFLTNVRESRSCEPVDNYPAEFCESYLKVVFRQALGQ
jgi:hypothetical protein